MDTNTYRLPTHPGDVQKEELEVRGITQKRFSEYTGIPYALLNEVLNAKRPVTSHIALVVEAALGINPELLINMQSRYNMAQARLKPNVEIHLPSNLNWPALPCFHGIRHAGPGMPILAP